MSNTKTIQGRTATYPESLLSIFLRSLPIKHGAHRILDHLKASPWKSASALVNLTYKGHKIAIDISDLVGWHFFILRSFDPEVTEIIKRYSVGDSTDIYWDIGANKGACSYAMATDLPLSKIVAIEPQHAMQQILHDNLDILAPGRHEIYAVGLGDTPGTYRLTVLDENRGRASLVNSTRITNTHIEDIEVVTSLNIISKSDFGYPTLIKIDVEGYEPAVIRSLKPAFSNHSIRCCVFECHKNERNAFDEIYSKADEFGYKVHAIRKSIYSTYLIPARTLIPEATDYAIIRSDLI